MQVIYMLVLATAIQRLQVKERRSLSLVHVVYLLFFSISMTGYTDWPTSVVIFEKLLFYNMRELGSENLFLLRMTQQTGLIIFFFNNLASLKRCLVLHPSLVTSRLSWPHTCDIYIAETVLTDTMPLYLKPSKSFFLPLSCLVISESDSQVMTAEKKVQKQGHSPWDQKHII